jgi:hypothetical protein
MSSRIARISSAVLLASGRFAKVRPLALAGIAVLMSVTLLSIGCSGKAQTRDVAYTRMKWFYRFHQYDRALKTGQDWLDADPNDAFMHLYVSALYLERAATSSDRKTELVGSAVKHANEAETNDPANPAVLQRAEVIFESAGDMISQERCAHYQSARNAADAMFAVAANRPEIESNKMQQFKEATYSRLTNKMAQSHCS